jgi:hypothetical protein
MTDKPKYIQGELNTPAQHNANSIIMEIACDLASELTEAECKNKKIKCLNRTEQEVNYTDKAQDIFNRIYDEKMDEVYEIANTVKGILTYDKLYDKLINAIKSK